MDSLTQSLREGALAGSLASVLSAAVLVACGRARNREPAAALNAISHWVWGDAALREDAPDLRHTALGYTIHHSASLFWSSLHARTWGKPAVPHSPATLAAQAAATAAVACFVDFKLTPHRFTPGFEHRLTRPQLVAVYAMFAAGLAIGSYAVRRRPARDRAAD